MAQAFVIVDAVDAVDALAPLGFGDDHAVGGVVRLGRDESR